MNTTRREFTIGAAALLATADVAQAVTLDFKPTDDRHFVIKHNHTTLLDFVDGDGRVIGWLKAEDIAAAQPDTPEQLLQLAAGNVSEQDRARVQDLYYFGEVYKRQTMTLEAAHQQFVQNM